MRLFKFMESDRELGCAYVHEIAVALLESNCIELIVGGQRMQVIFRDDKSALQSYAKLSAHMEHVGEAMDQFDAMFALEGTLQ